MKVSFKRFASVFLTLAILVSLFSQVPFSAFAATVTHDVTGTNDSKLSFTSNYDVDMQATGFGTEFLSKDRVDKNIFKNATFDLYRHDKQTLTPWSGGWSKTYDGVMDSTGTWSTYVYSQYGFPNHKDAGGARGYLTITLDNVYVLDELYILTAFKSDKALRDYEVYVGKDLSTLYQSANLVSSFNYTGYGPANDYVTGKLNHGPSGNSNNFAEGQIYTYGGTKKPTGKYIGIKLNETSNYIENGGYWLYLCELGAHGTAKANVSGDVLSNANLKFDSNYDVNINATNIPTTYFTKEMLDTNLVNPNGISLKRLSTGADITNSIAANSSWNDVIDGVFDNAKGHKSFAYIGNVGDTGAYLTIKLPTAYEISDFYMLSTYHACRAIYDYELYISHDSNSLYNEENLVFSYNYSGYVRNSDTTGKLNTADSSSNAEGQIYNFTGDKKPVGQYIGVKITGMSQFDIYKQWIYFSELGAHGTPLSKVTGDVFSNEKLNYVSYYDLDLNATNIPTSTFTEEMVATNIIDPSAITIKKLSNGASVGLTAGGSADNQIQTTWAMATDGVLDYNRAHQLGHYAFCYDTTDTGVYVTLPLKGEYVLDDFYLMSAYHAERCFYQYEIYVGSDEKTLYDAKNKVFVYDYSGYTKGSATEGKLNTAEGSTLSEGQFYTFTGTKKPYGTLIGLKITGMNNFSTAPRWLYFSEIGAHGTKISGCDEHEGRDMTIKSSVYDNTIFDNSVTYQETAFFYEGRSEYKLLYPIDEIITVRSYDLKKEYRNGIDYVIKDGKLCLTEGTSIPLYANPENNADFNVVGGAKWTTAGTWKTKQWKYQLNISYTHSSVWDEDALYVKGIEGKLNDISKFHEKASSDETTNVIFIGDSITEGCNASGQDNIKVAQHATDATTKAELPARDCPHDVHVTGWKEYFGLSTRPDWANNAWATQVTDALTAKYGNNIVMTNRGIGSTSARWVNQHDNIEYLFGEGEGTTNMPNPDLVFIAYGMNELGESKQTQNQRTKNIIDFLRERNPDCSIVLVSAFQPNWPQSETNNLGIHEQGFYELAEEYDNMIVAPVNSMFMSVLDAKHVYDYTGNLLNHPNDFGVNIYADTILAVLEGEEATLELNSNIEGIKPTYTGSTLIGGKVTVTAPKVEGYTFSHFEINGLIVAGDETNSTVVSMATGKTVTAIYTKIENSENASVIFTDNNGEILYSTTVAIGDTLDSSAVLDAEAKLPEIFGYTKGNNGIYWNNDPQGPIVSDIVFSPIYIKNNDKVFTLTVNDGDVSNSTHAFDDAITVTAKGEGFSYWMDAVTGAVLSTEATYTNCMPGNIEITAIYGQEVPTKDVVSLNSAVNFIKGDTRYTAILTATTNIPDGAVVEEKGIIFTNNSGYTQVSGNITLNMETKQIAKTKKALDGNFMITNKNIKNGSVRYARAYVTYVLGGNVITEYSNYTATFNGEVQ